MEISTNSSCLKRPYGRSVVGGLVSSAARGEGMMRSSYSSGTAPSRPELVEIKHSLKSLKKEAEMRLTLDVEAAQSFDFLSDQERTGEGGGEGRGEHERGGGAHEHGWGE